MYAQGLTSYSSINISAIDYLSLFAATKLVIYSAAAVLLCAPRKRNLKVKIGSTSRSQEEGENKYTRTVLDT